MAIRPSSALMGVSGPELSQSPLEGADLQFSDSSGQEHVDHSEQEVPADHTYTHTHTSQNEKHNRL